MQGSNNEYTYRITDVSIPDKSEFKEKIIKNLENAYKKNHILKEAHAQN
jgi:hypothetical protein